LFGKTKGGDIMLREGEIRIPSACGLIGYINRKGNLSQDIISLVL